MKFLGNDIHDNTFLRYIKRFLISGYIEDMKYYETDKGTPQGGLISPILANAYLHYVLDLWFEKKVYVMLKERLKKFNLEMEESKTKIIQFGRYKGTKEIFDFLVFMHYNGVTRTGKYTVGHKMGKKKRKAKNKAITKWIKENRHTNLVILIEELNKKLTGIYAYYGINGLLGELYKIYYHTKYMLYNATTRRSQRKMKLNKYDKTLERIPIIKPKIYKNIWCWNIYKII